MHGGLIDATIIDTDTSAGGSRKCTRKNLPVGEVSYSVDSVVATGKGGMAARKEAPYASVAAAPNTIAYTEKYGGVHDRPGDSEELSTESF